MKQVAKHLYPALLLTIFQPKLELELELELPKQAANVVCFGTTSFVFVNSTLVMVVNLLRVVYFVFVTVARLSVCVDRISCVISGVDAVIVEVEVEVAVSVSVTTVIEGEATVLVPVAM